MCGSPKTYQQSKLGGWQFTQINKSRKTIKKIDKRNRTSWRRGPHDPQKIETCSGMWWDLNFFSGLPMHVKYSHFFEYVKSDLNFFFVCGATFLCTQFLFLIIYMHMRSQRFFTIISQLWFSSKISLIINKWFIVAPQGKIAMFM